MKTHNKAIHAFLAIAAALLLSVPAKSQVRPAFDRNYHFLHSDNLVADKDFYLLTVIDHSPEIKKIIANDSYFKDRYAERLNLLKSHVSDTCTHPLSLTGGFKFSA